MNPNADSRRSLLGGERKSVPPRVLYETLFILIIVFVTQFFWKDHAIIFALVPTLYFLIERWLRHRSWEEIGFRVRSIPQDIAHNWLFILLVSFIIQFLVVFVTRNWMPAFMEHVFSRVPISFAQVAQFVPALLVGALWEEINYRGLYQERLSWFIPMPFAIGITSLIFSLGHLAAGDPMIVLIDILLIILDSIFYGIIFARSKNIFVVWIAHFLANLFAIIFYALV